MTAGTGDGDKTMRMNTSDPSAHPGLRLNTSDDASHGFTPDMFEESKPQPQVAPIGDFSTCLLNIEKSLSGLADIAESRSVTLGDKYGKLADGCIDAMEDVQVLRNQANGIELDKDEAV